MSSLRNTILILLLNISVTCYGRVISSPSSSSSSSSGSFEGRIINGENAEPGEISYQVSLQRATDRFHFCGGSIFDSRYVITAAHCVLGRSPKYLFVVAGTQNISQEQGIVRNVERISVHEGYNSFDAYRNDIAILKLSEPLFAIPNVVSYVDLPESTQNISAGEEAVVSGWGRIIEGGRSPELLQRVTIEISDQNHCKKIYVQTFGMEVDESQVCADVPEGGKGSCHGDSGGPLTVDNQLTGLVSWANGCAREGYPTVFTRVSKFLDWIEKIVSLP